MGFSGAIATGIIMVVILYVLLSLPQSFDYILIFQDTDNEISEIEDKIDDTNVIMTNLSTSNSTNLVSFSITNTGQEKLWNYDKFNVLISYTGTTAANSESLSYTGTCSGNPSSGNWCVDSIQDDLREPSVLNPNEIMNIKSTVSENINGGTVITVFSTNNGVTTSSAFKP